MTKLKRAGSGGEDFFYVHDTGWSHWIVKSRYAVNLGNGFFEQLQSFAGKLYDEEGNAGDIAAWPGKTLNEAGLYRISPAA
jgi:hypothetical protein